MIYLAGLKIPQHLYEAASIDGANPWRKMWAITLPLLTPQMLFNVITMTIFSFQSIGAGDHEGATRRPCCSAKLYRVSNDSRWACLRHGGSVHILVPIFMFYNFVH